MKILIDKANGYQDILNVGHGGGYFDESSILWNELIDGILPPITLGGMIRIGNKLIFNQVRKDSHNAALVLMAGAKDNEIIRAEVEALILDILPELIDTMGKLPGVPESLKIKANAISVKLLELK